MFQGVVSPIVTMEQRAEAWLDIDDGQVLQLRYDPDPAYVAQIAKALAE